MRSLIPLITILLTAEIATAEPVQLKFAEFEDRRDLAALSQEIMAHEISRTNALLNISVSYKFESLHQAEAACKFVWDPAVRAIASGTDSSGNCSISLRGIPTPHSLYVLREAALPVEGLAGTELNGWSVSRELNSEEKGDPQRGARILTVQN